MKILMLVHRFPYPPSDGGRVRAYHMIRHLAKSHEVTVGSIVRSPAEEAAGQPLGEVCHDVLIGRVGRMVPVVRMLAKLPTRTPSSLGYFYAPDLAQQVDEALAAQRFDAIVAYCSSMAQYVEHETRIPKFLDFVDMDSQKWLAFARVHGLPKSLGYWLEGRKLQAAEALMAPKFDGCACITRAEQGILDGFQTGAASGWFPNGVDLDYFSRHEGEYDAERICFVGRMDYFPNQQAMVDFCANVLPRIREVRPGVTLSIVGAEPPQDIRDLGLIPGVEVTGTVADVRPWVSTAAMTVAPLKIARGTQNKILESWAMGVPVVTSPQAAGGVDAVDGRHILVADGPEATAAAVLQLLNNPAERQAFADAGRARVEERYTWDAAMVAFQRLFEQACERHARRLSG